MPNDEHETHETEGGDQSAPSGTGNDGPALGFVSGAKLAASEAAGAEVAGVGAPAAGATGASLGPVVTALGTGGAIIAGVAGAGLAGETVRSAVAGEKTPLDVADEFYTDLFGVQVHFGDIWGWVKGDYHQAASDRETHLQQAVTDSSQEFSDSTAGSSQLPCQAPVPQQIAEADPRQEEHDSYKSRCNQSAPPGLNPCDKRRWELQRNKDCRDGRQAWDDKWQPGRHRVGIEELNNAIRKDEKWIKENCG